VGVHAATLTLNTGVLQPLPQGEQAKELIVDYRKIWAEQAPINIDGTVVQRVESFKFFGVHITTELSWFKHTKTFVKA
jgi:hypothetical protein